MIFFPMPIPMYDGGHSHTQYIGPSKKDLCEKDLIVENEDGSKTITKCRLPYPDMKLKNYPTGAYVFADSICTCETKTKRNKK